MQCLVFFFFFSPKATRLLSGFSSLCPQGAVCAPCSESWEHLLSPTQAREGAGSAGPQPKARPRCSSLVFSREMAGGLRQCTLPLASQTLKNGARWMELYRITPSALRSVYFKQTWEGVWAGSLFVLEGIDEGFRVLVHPSSIWR